MLELPHMCKLDWCAVWSKSVSLSWIKLHGKTPMSNLDEKDKKLDLSHHKWSQDVTRHMLSMFHNLQVYWSTTRSTKRLQCIIVNMVPKFCKALCYKIKAKWWDSGTISDQHIEHSWTNIPEMLQYFKLTKPTTEWHILMTQIPFHSC